MRRPPLRILVVHNRYRQPGGEDAVFEAEAALLEEAGHAVQRLEVSNDGIDDRSLAGRARASAGAVWSRAGARVVASAAREARAEIVHFHNTFPLISPAAYAAARREGAAVVQTLHNFRPICPNALLFRDGEFCDTCVGRRVAWPGVLHACYRDSRTESAVAAAMIAFHRARRTWRRDVDRFIALSEASRSQFVRGGLPARRIVVKPNFVPDPGPPDPTTVRRGFLYAGRLDPNKGVGILLRAVAAAGPGLEPVTIAGDGPLRAEAEATPNVRAVGWLDRAALGREMAAARALVFPSLYHENFPVTIAEAFARGTPVIASAQGAAAEIVEDDITGSLTPAGDSAALARKLIELQHSAGITHIGGNARRAYVERFTPARNLEQLVSIYVAARERLRGR